MNLELIKYLESKAIVTKADIKKAIKANDAYAYLVLQRLVQRGILKKVYKGHYTASTDIYVIATNLSYPSYLSFLAASAYKGYTTQIPTTIHIASTRDHIIEFDNYRIILLKLRPIFGYDKIVSERGEIFVANDEKLLLDMLSHPRFAGNISEIINVARMGTFRVHVIVGYLKKIGNQALKQRTGFLLETYQGIDLWGKIPVHNSPVYLDKLQKQKEKNNKKWGVYY